MINLHLEKLNELIEEYKKSLQEARSLYDYQKNIGKQVENIGNLEKQLAAYSGDDSEETRALRQRLQNQLNDAQQQLQETEWDKYISETETFLADMYEDYEKVLNERLEDVDKLMHDMIGEVNKRGTDIKKAVEQVSKEVAYNMTESAKTTISNGTTVSDFKNKFDTYATNTEKAINAIKRYIASIDEKTVPDAVNAKKVQTATRVKYNAVKDGVDYNGIFDLNYYMSHNPDLQKAFGNDYDKYLEHFINYGMKEGRQASETFNLNYYKNKYKDLRDAFGNDNKKYYEHFLKYGMKEKRQASATFDIAMYMKLYEDLRKAFGKDFKKYYSHFNLNGITEGRHGYAVGAHSIANSQLAWTQEKGGELIYRSTDGAILTPLNVGDKVFTADMSENLWKLAQLKQFPIPSSSAMNSVTNNNAIAITLPNVTNYEQFKTALQNDPKMTQFIQQITFGEANGKAKLNKRKF